MKKESTILLYERNVSNQNETLVRLTTLGAADQYYICNLCYIDLKWIKYIYIFSNSIPFCLLWTVKTIV